MIWLALRSTRLIDESLFLSSELTASIVGPWTFTVRKNLEGRGLYRGHVSIQRPSRTTGQNMRNSSKVFSNGDHQAAQVATFALQQRSRATAIIHSPTSHWTAC